MVDTLISQLSSLGSLTLGPFWLPVLTWTLLAGGAYLLAGEEDLPARAGYHLGRALYWALPVGIVLALLADQMGAELLAQSESLPVSTGARAGGGSAEPAPISPPAVQNPGWAVIELIQTVVGGITLIAGVTALWSLIRLGGEARLLNAGQHGAPAPDQLQARAERMAEGMGIARMIRVRLGDNQAVPMTYGFFRPVIVLPASVVDENREAEMILAHELAHVQRADYLQRGGELLWAALLSFHPLVRTLRNEIDTYREMCCDEEVLQTLKVDTASYARLLYESARETATGGAFLSLNRHSSTLHRRIRAMSTRTTSASESFLHRYSPAWALIAVLTVSTLVACSESMGPENPSPSIAQEQANPSSEEPTVFVAVEQMPELQGGLEGLRERIDYPSPARQSRPEGTVIVRFTVTTDGQTENVRLAAGPEGPLADEVLRVARDARFKPAKQRGKPVAVELVLPVRFALSGSSSESGSPVSGDQVISDPNVEVTIEAPSESATDAEKGAGIITGRVTGPNGEPLPETNIYLIDTTVGATPDADGLYRITDAPTGQVSMRFSHVGYATVAAEDVTVKERTATTVSAQLDREPAELQRLEITAAN